LLLPVARELLLEDQQPSVLVPVPLHWWRQYRRGYNQSYEMARMIGKKTATPVYSALRRSRRTAVQARLARAQRLENLQDAFALKKGYREKLEGKRIILIDDAYTTGATVKACAEVLQEAQPAKIEVLTLLRS